MTTQLRQARCSHRLPTFHLALTGDQGVLVDSPVSRKCVPWISLRNDGYTAGPAGQNWGTARTRDSAGRDMPGYLPGRY